jgi:formylglycine-generating enzyme required for sulfatase activity
MPTQIPNGVCQNLTCWPFDEGQVTRFVERWYRAVRPVMGWDEKTSEQRGARLAQGIQQKPYLADLASRPLLLTLMATLDSSWGKLPEDRADLYEESVKLLLSRWQRGREVRNEQGGLDWEPSITRALGVGEELIRSALEKLAYLTHVRQSAEQKRDGDSADIPRAEVLQAFCDVLPEDVNAELVLRYLETRSGLLMGRRENVYAFPHRSFQEYLAACHLAAVEQDFALKLRELVYADLDWWREVFLLGVGKQRLGGLGGAVGLVSMLMPTEVDYAKDITDTDWRVSVLAGQALLEMRLEERSPGQASFREIMARAARWLVRIVESGHLTPAQRLEAGDALAALGDPRFDEKLWSLPVLLHSKPEPLLGFVHIPGGAFVMGSADDDKDAYKDERPRHKVNLPDFYLARYLLTNAQYAHFMEAGGYETAHYWTPQGWDWRQGRDFDLSLIKDDDLRKNYQEWLSQRPQEKRGQPFFWNHPQWGAPTRPVVGVSWYETLAYCAWLEEQLKTFSLEHTAQGGLSAQESTFWDGLATGRLCVGLPSEAHWEKAARMSIVNRQSKIENPTYPWGNEITPEHANYDETGLKQTSPVGMFPRGASALGLLDLSGNVWEWTHTRWGLDPYNSTFNYPYFSDEREAEDAPDLRVLRGGSWASISRSVRCASRYWSIPDLFDASLGFRMMVSPGYSATLLSSES